MAFGIYDKSIPYIGAGVDTSILRRQALRDGTTFEAVLNMTNTAVRGFNARTSPLVSLLTYQSDSLDIRVPQGSMVFSAASEYSPPDAQHVSIQGWMMQPVQEYLGIQMTWQWMRNHLRGDVEQALAAAIAAAEDAIEYNILNRLADSSLISVESGYSPGLASGNGTVTYTPPKYGGTTFDTTHSHYNRDNGLDDCAATNTADLLEHGIAMPYVHLVSSANRTAWQSEGNFIAREIEPVRRANSAAAALGGEFAYAPLDDERIGFCADGSIIPQTRIPTNYVITLRENGPNNRANPIWVMMPPEGVPLMTRPGTDLMTDGIMLYLELFMGVGNPIGAAAAFNNSTGSYVDPVITR